HPEFLEHTKTRLVLWVDGCNNRFDSERLERGINGRSCGLSSIALVPVFSLQSKRNFYFRSVWKRSHSAVANTFLFIARNDRKCAPSSRSKCVTHNKYRLCGGMTRFYAANKFSRLTVS